LRYSLGYTAAGLKTAERRFQPLRLAFNQVLKLGVAACQLLNTVLESALRGFDLLGFFLGRWFFCRWGRFRRCFRYGLRFLGFGRLAVRLESGGAVHVLLAVGG
jgi:hypothetical protein